MGPEKGLGEASSNSDTLGDTSMLHITNRMDFSFLEPALMLDKMLYINISRKHRPSLTALDNRFCRKMDSDRNDLKQQPDNEEEEKIEIARYGLSKFENKTSNIF